MSSAARAKLPENPFATPIPIPQQPPMKEGVASVNGAKIYYTDTGGAGPVIALFHPATGSALMWPYQQPAFVAAGFRVIAWSRRGYYGSSALEAGNEGLPSHDALALMDFLGVQKFAGLASAAGCGVLLDIALAQPARLEAAIFSQGSFSGIDEADYIDAGKRVMTKGFEENPPEFREIGPSYRASNGKGVAEWLALHAKAGGALRKGMGRASKLNWATISKMTTPSLFIAGDADLYAPPALMRMVAEKVPNAEMVVFNDCGHSAYWEMPEEFNRVAIAFLKQHA